MRHPADLSPTTPTAIDSQVGSASLDPLDWQTFSTTCQRALVDIIDYLRTVRERLVWQPVPPAVRQQLEESCPQSGLPLSEVYEQFRQNILPYPTGNIHPRFWGWVVGSGTADGVLAEMLAATMNCNVPGYDQSAAVVEQLVVRWFVEVFDFPGETSGLLVSGGTMANYIGLAVARNARAGFPVRRQGLRGARALTVYASSETHGWAMRSCELLGLGSDALRLIPVDWAGRVRTDVLLSTLMEDRSSGLQPICLIGNAGTVNTGAIDPLNELADIARSQGLWFHVDGAFGAHAYALPELRDELSGMQRADSLAFDLHKWGYLPYDVGCVLVRDAKEHRAAFSMAPSYLVAPGRGVLAQPMEFYELGPDLSRGFRALKVWFGLKHHGLNGWRSAISSNIHLARYLAALLKADPSFEVVAPVTLNIVAFRCLTPEEADADRVNQELMLRLQEQGIAVVTATKWSGKLVLRAAIVNHRTTCHDVDMFVEATGTIASRIISERCHDR